jgi:SNF2 family DNA or RNA helicase
VALIATYGALREGVTLHRARIVVHHDLHWLLTALLQAEARIYRIGQTRACESIWMIAAGTIDALLAPLLMRKAEAMSAVLGQTKGEDSLRELALLDAAGSLSVDQQLSEALDAWRVA